MDIEKLRAVAVDAAQAGDAVIRDWHARGGALHTRSKGFGDYVTAVDRAAEAAILEVLRRDAPDIAVLAEESGGNQGELFWAVDPLDGTTNFLRGFPVVGVSVGLVERGTPIVAAIAAPFLQASWSAARNLGAHDHTGTALHVEDGDGRGVVATGFPFRQPEKRARYLPVFERVLEEFEDVRRAGAACLDLAYSAQGSFDGFFELGLALWDFAAGALLVREAGGVVTDWDGDEQAVFRSGDILAGAPRWHDHMLRVTRNLPAASGPTVPR